jgi:hypothetical protein
MSSGPQSQIPFHNQVRIKAAIVIDLRDQRVVYVLSSFLSAFFRVTTRPTKNVRRSSKGDRIFTFLALFAQTDPMWVAFVD